MRARLAFLSITIALIGAAAIATAGKGSKPADWSINATVIEACSCPMFCQCYFNTKPAAHHEHAGMHEQYCRFNNAYRVNKGHYGDVKLDGAKFWLAGDLGAEFDDGEMDWTVATFDKSTTPEQREGLQEIIKHLFPVKWKSVATREGTIDWSYDKEKAHATIDGGKTAEVKLTRFQGMTDDPVVIKNLKYWGAPRNEGFVMMPNEVEAWRIGDKAFEFKGTNGFMLTIDMNSKELAKSSGSSM